MDNNQSNINETADRLTNLLLDEMLRQVRETPTPSSRPSRRPPGRNNGRINNNTNVQNRSVNVSQRNFTNLLDTVYDMMHIYNNNIRDYNRNINQLMQFVLDAQSMIRTQQIQANWNSSPIGNINPPNLQRQTAQTFTTPNPVPDSFATPNNHFRWTNLGTTAAGGGGTNNTTGLNNGSTNLLFSYMFEPLFNEQQNDNLRPMNRDEINMNTRTFTYEENSLPEDRRSCPISMENFQLGDIVCEIRGCGHTFRRPALINWLRRSSLCPVCRYNIRTYHENSANQSTNNNNNNEPNLLDLSIFNVNGETNNTVYGPQPPSPVPEPPAPATADSTVSVEDDEDVSDIELDLSVD